MPSLYQQRADRHKELAEKARAMGVKSHDGIVVDKHGYRKTVTYWHCRVCTKSFVKIGDAIKCHRPEDQ